VTNYFEGGEFPLHMEEQGLRKGRSIYDGYARGWGLEFGGIRDYVLGDPIYQQAMALAQGRTIQAENCRMNLFLLAKYFLPRLLNESAGGSIVEFGSFRGGSAIFLASVCRSLGLNAKVYGLDTFEGMPPTDKGVDAHNAGDFAGVDLGELRAYVESSGLSDHLEFVQGMFEATAPALLARIQPVLLAHIDCDVYDSVAFSWDVVQPYMASGGYVAFDDAHTSSCLGATEAVEDLVIRGEGLNCEQIWPHFVFRVWHGIDPVAGSDPAGQLPKVERSGSELMAAAMQRAQLQTARGEIARLQQHYLELTDKLKQAQERILDLEGSLAESRVRLEDLGTRHATLSKQVTMAQRSRWLKLGRLMGVGPEFVIPD